MYMPGYGCTDTYNPLPTAPWRTPAQVPGTENSPHRATRLPQERHPGETWHLASPYQSGVALTPGMSAKAGARPGREPSRVCVLCIFCGTLPCQSALARFQSPHPSARLAVMYVQCKANMAFLPLPLSLSHTHARGKRAGWLAGQLARLRHGRQIGGEPTIVL
jgi:hypothetical protein